MTTFDTLNPDGTFRHHATGISVRIMNQATFAKCPFVIMLPEHYNTTDGTPCQCHNPEYRKIMIRQWGYTKRDFAKAGIK